MKIEEIKDKVARNEYGLDYCMLSESQKVILTDLIAGEYAISELNKFTNTILKTIEA
jgi:hypothetical protein